MHGTMHLTYLLKTFLDMVAIKMEQKFNLKLQIHV